MSAPLLVVDNLCVAAGDQMILDSASFILDAGTRTGIIGESGSGKTMTALAILITGAHKSGSAGAFSNEGVGITASAFSTLAPQLTILLTIAVFHIRHRLRTEYRAVKSKIA